MGFISNKTLPRRTFLRGVGATVALPLLESMLPAVGSVARAAQLSPTRFTGIFIPHGAAPGYWVPSGERNFDLPFIFQRCLANNVSVKPFVDLSEYTPRGVYDTMRAWWLGSRNRVALDDVAWALGIESSKTSEVEGSRVFELYQAGKLAEIREYNLNDVRVTRKVYERMVACFGG